MDFYIIPGEKITSLIKDIKYSPGVYEIEFVSNDIPGGVYLYKLQSDDKSVVNKLIVIK